MKKAKVCKCTDLSFRFLGDVVGHCLVGWRNAAPSCHREPILYDGMLIYTPENRF